LQTEFIGVAALTFCRSFYNGRESAKGKEDVFPNAQLHRAEGSAPAAATR